MTFEVFRTAATIAALRSGNRGKLSFFNDGGKYIAHSDGITLSSCGAASRVEIKWGSGHRAYATLGQLIGDAV